MNLPEKWPQRKTLIERTQIENERAQNKAEYEYENPNSLSDNALNHVHKSWTCMYRNDKGETGSMHGNIESITRMAIRLGATSISLALENDA